MKIDWGVTVQAFALLGYEFKPPEGFDAAPVEVQLEMWDLFLQDYFRCVTECLYSRVDRPCSDACPKHVLRRMNPRAPELRPRNWPSVHIKEE